jgi:hypothetical protein
LAECIGDDLTEGDLLQPEPQGRGLDAAELEQVVDQPGEAVALHPQCPVVARHVVALDQPVLERLDHGPDAGERRAQVV